MGPGIVILVWGAILGFFALIWVALVVLTIFGWRKKIAWLKWGAGIPAGLMVVSGVALAVLVVFGIIRSMQPSVVFEDTFGIPPSAEFTEIESSVFWFADSGSVYLRFRTSESELRRLVSDDLIPLSMSDMKKSVPFESSARPPEWWTYRYHEDWLYFLRNEIHRDKPAKRGFYSETEYLAYDPNTQTAYYRFLGID